MAAVVGAVKDVVGVDVKAVRAWIHAFAPDAQEISVAVLAATQNDSHEASFPMWCDSKVPVLRIPPRAASGAAGIHRLRSDVQGLEPSPPASSCISGYATWLAFATTGVTTTCTQIPCYSSMAPGHRPPPAPPCRSSTPPPANRSARSPMPGAPTLTALSKQPTTDSRSGARF